MATVTFDTLKFANRLKAAGFDPKHAEAEAEALSEVFESNLGELATKSDLQKEIRELRGELKMELADVKSDIKLLKWMLGVVVAGVVALVIKAFLYHT